MEWSGFDGGDLQDRISSVQTLVGTPPGQVLMVLQGGGALGCYQAGSTRHCNGAGVERDWIIASSIGAINPCLTAGSEPERRLARLR